MYQACPEEPGVRVVLRDGEPKRRAEREEEKVECVSMEEFIAICTERKRIGLTAEMLLHK